MAAHRWSPSMADSCVQARDSQHYRQLYINLQKEYSQLQHSQQILQTQLLPGPGIHMDSEERNLAVLRNRITAADTEVTDLKRLFKADGKEEQTELGRQMLEEKQVLVKVYIWGWRLYNILTNFCCSLTSI